MLAIASAIVEHSCRIMFFRHDGSGLPTKKGGTLYLILAVAILARMLRDVADPAGFSAAISVIACGIYVLLTTVMFRPSSMAALMLANTFGYALIGVLHVCGISTEYVSDGVLIWEIAALFVVLNKIVRRAQQDHKNKTSTKK